MNDEHKEICICHIMYSPPSSQFLTYLDKYKTSDNTNFTYLFDLCNYDYMRNGYYHPNFSGHHQLYTNPNSLNISQSPQTSILKSKKQPIDSSLNTIADVLSMLDNYPYDKSVEYNIDLKSLHSIKPELELLNNMVGLETLKSSILDQLLYFMQGLHLGNDGGEYKHTVLFGPPGTGKTEVAKVLGTMYAKLGILRRNVFKKVTRADLVAGYLGQTRLKTRAVLDDVSGGVLFIDEAYALGGSGNDVDSFSKECVDTLCEALSDRKDDVMVMIAGYEDELNSHFFSVNKGLESRFIWRFPFEGYTSSQLLEIFRKKVADANWSFMEASSPTVQWFEKRKSEFKFYGRDMEQLFLYSKIAHARRLFGKDVIPKQLNMEDIEKGYKQYLANRKKDKTVEFRKSIVETMYL